MDSAPSTASPAIGPRPLRIGLIAGEASGDILGASLLQALKVAAPGRIEARGIGGPRMQAEGFHSLYEMERLSVMGFVEPLKRLPELLRMRAGLARELRAWGADVVVGIDSPDFCLGLEKRLRRQGIKTAHFVSPSVWAWRQGRIKTIAAAVDHMLVLFPFEEQFYREHGVPVTFVGHPLADQLPLTPDQAGARAALGVAPDAQVVALLPGSRGGEVGQLAPILLATAAWLHSRQPALQFLLPAANPARRAQLEPLLAGCSVPIQLLDGESQQAMAAADVVVMASGTTTLEAMLLKRPMVVAYRMGNWTYALLKRLVRSPFIALPNLLAGRELVPERLQEQATPEILGPLTLTALEDATLRQRLIEEFTTLHQQLRRDAGQRAATVVLGLAESA